MLNNEALSSDSSFRLSLLAYKGKLYFMCARAIQELTRTDFVHKWKHNMQELVFTNRRAPNARTYMYVPKC